MSQAIEIDNPPPVDPHQEPDDIVMFRTLLADKAWVQANQVLADVFADSVAKFEAGEQYCFEDTPERIAERISRVRHTPSS